MSPAVQDTRAHCDFCHEVIFVRTSPVLGTYFFEAFSASAIFSPVVSGAETKGASTHSK